MINRFFSQFVDITHNLYDYTIFPYWRINTDADPVIQNGGVRIQNDETNSIEYIMAVFDDEQDRFLANLETGKRYVLTYTILESYYCGYYRIS